MMQQSGEEHMLATNGTNVQYHEAAIWRSGCDSGHCGEMIGGVGMYWDVRDVVGGYMHT